MGEQSSESLQNYCEVKPRWKLEPRYLDQVKTNLQNMQNISLNTVAKPCFNQNEKTNQ